MLLHQEEKSDGYCLMVQQSGRKHLFYKRERIF